jgi:hypothetical protein
MLTDFFKRLLNRHSELQPRWRRSMPRSWAGGHTNYGIDAET